jgi:hypothetical protein
MKTLFFTLLVGLLTLTAFADVNKKSLDTKIEHVTVFLDGAQINRSGKTTVPTGKSEVTIKGLSPYLDKSSISVKGEGVTVLSVTHQLNKLDEKKKKDEVLKLLAVRDKFDQQLSYENNMRDVYVQAETTININNDVKGQNVNLDVQGLKALMDYQEQKLIAIKKTLMDYDKRIAEISDTLTKLNAQLNIVSANKDVTTSDVVVLVDSKSGREASFTISYFVSYAGWFPTYDVRVDDISQPLKLNYKANVHQNTGEDWKDVKLTLSNAQPKQSGILPFLKPWYVYNGNYSASKTTSSYNPQYPGKVTDPNVREIRGRVYDENGEALIGTTVIVKGTTIGTSSDMEGNYSLQIPVGAQAITVSYVGYERQDIPIFSSLINIRMKPAEFALNEVVVSGNKVGKADRMERTSQELKSVAGVSVSKQSSWGYGGGREGAFEAYADGVMVTGKPNIPTEEIFSPTTYSFDIETPYSIPDDGKTYSVDIKEQDVNAEYVYLAIPKLDKDAFLTARIINWDQLNLLDGEANLFFEGTYLGKTLINTAQQNDTLTLSLGRDKSVSVSRTKVKDFSKRTFFGDKKVVTRNWELVVRNNKKQPINVVLEDQFPISSQNEVEIDKQEYNEAKLDDETGKLTWTLLLSPSTEKKVSFKYTVKYPKNYSIVLE